VHGWLAQRHTRQGKNVDLSVLAQPWHYCYHCILLHCDCLCGYVQISVAVKHGMVGLLVFDDRGFSHRGHRRCSSNPPRAVIDVTHQGTDPLSPGFPSSGQQCVVCLT